MKLALALAGALFLSLFCEKVDAQVAREAFYSIPSETMSAADFLTGKKEEAAANKSHEDVKAFLKDLFHLQ
jgi:hypothetical protein